jgi:ribonuclease P/MRP protein subunit POP3
MSLKEAEKRRTVFKPLLDNPFPSSQFPLVPHDSQHQIMEFLLLQLQDVANWNEIKGTKPAKPEILDHLTMGFNSTVKFLEAQAKEPQKRPMRYVFVCKTEISPQLLVQQFPALCYTASNGIKVKLIQLPRGAMSQLQEKLAMKCAILGMFDNDVISRSFKELLESVPDVEVPWLNNPKFRELKVKMLETTAPITKKQNK